MNFTCKINEKQIFMNENQIILTSTKSMFKTQLCVRSNTKNKSYLTDKKKIMVKRKTKTTTIETWACVLLFLVFPI
jgi:hypothetical protein